MSAAYLIGNGINRACNAGPSWQDVLSRLTEGVDLSVGDMESKPFPFVFQELTAKADVKSRTLRKRVAKHVGEIESGDLHKQLMSGRVRHVLTVNYDLSLEASGEHRRCEPHWERSTKYSIFRNRMAGSTRVWHLHGEISEPRSILLGYDHYTGALQRMRQYLKATYRGRSSPFKAGISKFEHESIPYSWIDVFLRDDIEILGLGLDYSEIDVWWALTYKNHLKRRGWPVGKTRYWAIEPKKSYAGDAKYPLLKALDVSVKHIDVENDSWHAAWKRAIKKLPKA